MTTTDTATIGHNRGPAFDPERVAALTHEAQEIADAASEWARTEIDSDTLAGQCKDFLDAARAKFQEVENQRKAEKQPFLDAGREVDAAFGKVRDIIEAAAKLAKAPLEAYAREQKRIADERRRKEQEAARKAAEEAERQRKIAEKNANAAAMAEAEEAARKAAEAQKAADAEAKVRISSATGTGARSTSLRTVRSARIASINMAMLHYRDRAELAECIVRMANADIRAAKGEPITIPGVDIITEEKL